MVEPKERRPTSLMAWRAVMGRPGFTRLWLLHMLTSVAGQIHIIALTWVAIQQTGSEAVAGTLLMITAIPRVVVLPFGGSFADRRPIREVLLWALSAMVILATVMGLLLKAGDRPMWMLGTLVSVFGVSIAVYAPAAFAAIPAMAERKNLESANALIQLTTQAGPFLGPAAAAALIPALGFDGSYFAIAALLGLAALLAGTLQVPRAVTGLDDVHLDIEGEGSTLSAEAAGTWSAVLRSPQVSLLLLTSVAANLSIIGPLQVGLAALVRHELQAGPETHGVLVSIFGLGSLAGTASVGMLFRGAQDQRSVYRWMMVLGSIWTLVGRGHGVPVLGVLLFISGICVGVVSVLVITHVQAAVPNAVLGRAMGVLLLSSAGLQPISLILAGHASQWVGSAGVFLASGVIAVAAGWVGEAIAWRTTRNREPA